MIVSIIKCDNPFSWYYEEIGKSYEVTTTIENGKSYFVLDDTIRYINTDDAVDIKDLRINKLNRVLKNDK